jgi:hypothetical protein
MRIFKFKIFEQIGGVIGHFYLKPDLIHEFN